MKKFTIILSVAIIFISAILTFLFVDNVSENSTPNTKTEAVQEKNQEAEEQKKLTAKGDSFTADKVFDKEKGSPDNVEAMVDRGKNFLLTQVGNRLEQLGPFIASIENTANLSDSERKSLVAELNAEIAMFEAFKSEINKSATKQDIKNVADKIKTEWIKSTLSVQRAEEQILATKENQLLSDADAVSLGIQKRIDALKALGKNTKAHEELLSAYGKKIASAKQDIESAKEKSGAAVIAPTEDEKEKLIKGNELLLKSAHDNIKGAYKMLTEVTHQDFSQRYK